MKTDFEKIWATKLNGATKNIIKKRGVVFALDEVPLLFKEVADTKCHFLLMKAFQIVPEKTKIAAVLLDTSSSIAEIHPAHDAYPSSPLLVDLGNIKSFPPFISVANLDCLAEPLPVPCDLSLIVAPERLVRLGRSLWPTIFISALQNGMN